MVYDSGEVVMSLESEVIWVLILLIGFFLSLRRRLYLVHLARPFACWR